MEANTITIVYGIIALFSALLFIGQILFIKEHGRLFIFLFGCIAASNIGYFLLSICNSLTVAKMANGISYFGGAFSMLVMLLIIYDVCQMKRRKWFVVTAVCISIVMFIIAASCDLMGLYYKSVSIETVDGITRLIKDYGPLHNLYAIYLGVYAVLMLSFIAFAARKRRLNSPKYTLFLLFIVLLNIGVWLAEKLISVEFEFLSISYIVTAILLLLIYNMLCDYGIIQPGGKVVSVQMLTQINAHKEATGTLPEGIEEMFSAFSERINFLTAAEHNILTYYINGYDIIDIPDLAYISINTVKKHNRSIYQKLNVSSRDELMLYIELFRCCGRLNELTGDD